MYIASRSCGKEVVLRNVSRFLHEKDYGALR